MNICVMLVGDVWAWKQLSADGGFLGMYHTAVVAANRCVLVFGGCTIEKPALDELWVFNVEAKKWQEKKFQANRKPCARRGHSAALSKDNSMFVFGGQDGRGKLLADLWKYIPSFV